MWNVVSVRQRNWLRGYVDIGLTHRWWRDV